VSTVIDSLPRGKFAQHHRWERIRRAELLEAYRDLQTQGLSQRQAAKQLEVPRTTLQAWRAWQGRLDACPQVLESFESVPGLAFLHRLVLAFHVVCVKIGACGIRLVCLFLQMMGLNRFVGASYGTQQQINRGVEEAIGAYRQEESKRLTREMPAKDITLTQDETFTGGLCLVGMDPVSNYILLEQAAQARDQDTWQALMEQALAGPNCQVMQSTSDEAPGLLAYVAHHLGAHHSPDVFHVQHELRKAVSAPMATKQRAAEKAAAKAEETLKRVHEQLHNVNNAPAQRGPGRPPQVAPCLEQLEQDVEGLCRKFSFESIEGRRSRSDARGRARERHQGAQRHGAPMAPRSACSWAYAGLWRRPAALGLATPCGRRVGGRSTTRLCSAGGCKTVPRWTKHCLAAREPCGSAGGWRRRL
jgi:helix-turn-helix, Psq domain